ncbi:MAG: hypothetical protein VYB84_02580, partial [Pseudomonadota bacterium]|nr:hypothetical protein [Pseudomonadota bacterium]
KVARVKIFTFFLSHFLLPRHLRLQVFFSGDWPMATSYPGRCLLSVIKIAGYYYKKVNRNATDGFKRSE